MVSFCALFVASLNLINIIVKVLITCLVLISFHSIELYRIIAKLLYTVVKQVIVMFKLDDQRDNILPLEEVLHVHGLMPS